MLPRQLLASALWVAQASASVLDRRAVDQTTFDSLKYWVTYAAVAYCQPNVDTLPAGTFRPLTCTSCPMAGANITWTSLAPNSPSPFGPTGFIAIDKKKKTVVLAWQGTSFQNAQQILTIANFVYQVPQPQICNDCWSAAGLVASWDSVKSAVTAAIKLALRDNPSYTVVITGHSLGGALAGQSSADFQAANPTVPVKTYTYASSRWANKKLAQWLSARPGIARITHHKDAVPRIIPTQLFGADYSHVAPEYFISKGPLTPTVADINYLPASGSTLESGAGNSGPAGAGDSSTNYLDEHTNYIIPVQC